MCGGLLAATEAALQPAEFGENDSHEPIAVRKADLTMPGFD